MNSTMTSAETRITTPTRKPPMIAAAAAAVFVDSTSTTGAWRRGPLPFTTTTRALVAVATITMFMIGNATIANTAAALVAIVTPHQAKNSGTSITSGVAPNVTANGPNSQ